MGIKDRKERERQEMRDLILEAAKGLFLQEGYDKTSIRSIAEKIEYSPGTIYQYFTDKDEIFLTLHHAAFESLFVAMEQVNDLEDSFERFRALGHIYLRFAIEHPELYDLMFIMRAPMNALQQKDEEWQRGYKTYDFVRDVVQECIDKQLLRFNDVDLATLSIWSHVHGLASLLIRNRFKMLPQDRLEEIISACIESTIRVMRVGEPEPLVMQKTFTTGSC